MVVTVVGVFPAGNGWAQVATPSLDQTLLTYMPAATGWRSVSTAGASIISGSSVENEGTNAEVSISWSELSYIITSPVVKTFFTEAFTARQKKEYESVNQNDTYEINRAQVNFAYLQDKFVSYGANYFSSENKLESDYAFFNEVKDEQTGLGFGVSLLVLDQIYLAFGLEQTEEKSTNPSSGSLVIKTTWINQLFGIAIVGGPKDKPFFRIELSRIVSPEAEGSNSNSSTPSHYASTNSRLAIEFIAEKVDVLFRFERQNEIEDLADNLKLEKEYDSYGAMKTNKNGWIYGIYLISGKESNVFSYSNSTSQQDVANSQNYRLTIGYNF